ncbi:conserved protein of unknown function [Rhodovastum atsumiense]|uniref:DUF3299 domain-containing protein n=1 Tax=Rhodovastum atsumiense TaxID=504468 RepID=A0A5M6IY95_9PROT|nr:hypothetical protein [Rhodovastum atsumiense]KAA5613292.1 hypothetical protein F1189_06275 [Rhodovastum atsumiense]CAH2600541.1 conserved protein of unknown function [Rhodovastum atsumiense]
MSGGGLPTRRSLLGGAALLASRPARAEDETLTFETLYSGWGVRGLVFSDRVKALAGRRVGMRGYMAPPLKAESPFFVLTREPLSLCPFCQSDAEWPVDIVVIYLRRAGTLVGAGEPVRVLGRLDIGSWTDPESGFVSLLRLVDAEYRRA